MTSSNINKYVLKCYINLSYVVPVEMESSRQFSAIAMLRFMYKLNTLTKKFIKKLLVFIHIILN